MAATLVTLFVIPALYLVAGAGSVRRGLDLDDAPPVPEGA